MADLEKDKILLLAHSIGKMARELQSIKRLLKEMADTPQTETKTETQNSNLTFEKRTMRDCYNCKRYETEGECVECHYEPRDEPQTEEWTKEKHEAFYTFLWNTINPNEMEEYIEMYEAKDEPQTEGVSR